jgi:type I restriction enzyme S subunit
MKPGYKQTEAGVIPEEWNIVKLGRVASFKTGPFGSALHQSDYVYGGIPIVNPMQIVDGRIVPTPSMAISPDASRKLADFRLYVGDIVIGRRGEMGRCANVQPTEDGWLCGTGSMIVKPSPALDGRFAQRVLSSPSVIAAIENCSVGTTMINLNQGTLSNLIIALPPTKEEQEDIAEALSDADALIESLAQLLAKKRDLKQGAMQELLTGKRRMPGFAKSAFISSEIGLVPIDWRVVQIGSIANVKTGPFGSALHEKDYVDEGTPIITVEHLGERGITSNNAPMVSDTDRRRLSSYSLEPGDIVFSRVGSVDRNALVSPAESGWLFSGRLLRLRTTTDAVDPQFLSHQFHGEPFKQRVRTVAVGQTMASLNTQILKQVLIVLPSREEQTAIATLLSAMDAEIANLESNLAKARELKQGMMQELLTGRIRLI